MKSFLLASISFAFSVSAQASTLKCFVDEEMGPKEYISKDLSNFDGLPVSIGQVGGLPVTIGLYYVGNYEPMRVGEICSHVRTSGDFQRICSESKLNLKRLVQVDGKEHIESIYISCELIK